MPASSYVNRDHAGGAVDTTIAPGISGSDLSITIASSTGWPSGGANGPFHVIVDYDIAGKEKIEVASRTGTTLTIADTGKRGIDGTSAATHASGAKIRHCYTAIDAQEANDHITNTALDHHTQYLNTSRHAAIVHTAAMLGTDSVGSDEIAAGAVGSSELASASVTAGKIAVGGISAANQFAAGVVDAAAIATDAVGSAEIAADAVGSAEIAASAVGSSELAAASVIAGKYGAGSIVNADIADGVISFAKILSVASTDFSASVTFTNPTGNFVLGTGGVKFANYYKIGRIVLYWVHFQLGTGGNITAGGTIEVNLPFANTADHRGFAAAKARQNAGTVSSGTAAIGVGASVVTNFVTAGTGAQWDATSPFNWDAGDSFDAIIIYEAAS